MSHHANLAFYLYGPTPIGIMGMAFMRLPTTTPTSQIGTETRNSFMRILGAAQTSTVFLLVQVVLEPVGAQVIIVGMSMV